MNLTIMDDLVVWTADIGSVRRNRFGWCRIAPREDAETGKNIDDFVKAIAKDLTYGQKVALGFECPLFVPVSNNPVHLTHARKGEGRHAWCASAGSGSLATGLTICVWVFEQIKHLAKTPVQPTFNWRAFTKGQSNLFIWEAFVSGTSKTDSHHGDAEIAAHTFMSSYPQVSEANAISAENPYSLVGAALLRSGLTTDLSFLFEPCIVVKS